MDTMRERQMRAKHNANMGRAKELITTVAIIVGLIVAAMTGAIVWFGR